MQKTLVARASTINHDQGHIDSRPYALGYSEGELRRLVTQSVFLDELTEDVLKRAGIAPGMRVLDLGCGVGDVSLLAGRLVGPSGFVLGVDRSIDAIAMAERRATEAGQCYWVRFAAAELDAFLIDETFDAIIGRLILMYLPDPAATLRRLCEHLNPGGIVAFHEMNMSQCRSIPEVPEFGRCRYWIIEAIRRTGFETEMGDRLLATYLTAGLPAPQMIAAGRAEGGLQSSVYDYIAETVRSLLPAIERVGIATAAEMGIDTLSNRLRKDCLAHEARIMLPLFIGAWTHAPA